MKVKLNINDVAVKQLESAIWMYAYNYDEVAVHTVAGASFELYTKRLGLSSFKKDVSEYIKKDMANDFFSQWNKAYNFFKHGEHQNTPIEELEYDENSVELLIFYAVEGNLAGPEKYKLSCAKIFKYFYLVRHPELFEPREYTVLFEQFIINKNLRLEEVKDKKTLRMWLDTIGHTFLNGTNSPYRDIAKI